MRAMASGLTALGLVFILMFGGCHTKAGDPTERVADDPSATALPGDASAAPATSSRSAADEPSKAPRGASTETDCPGNMVLVEGAYCPIVEQRCKAHTEEFEREERRRQSLKLRGETLTQSHVSERCIRYESPSICLSKSRQNLRFCIDRYEWPNEAKKLPEFAVTWTRAQEQCAAVEKRLCGIEEFNFACEGEAMLPYAYGFERDAKRCNIDKPYVVPLGTSTPYEACMQLPYCKASLEKLDQRVPAGSMPECVSPFGVMDMNGNVNEWVERAGESAPWRSGLKGGWWGPSRSRCRPTVTAHNELYAGYEVGFRCCKDAAFGRPEAPQAGPH